jgi:hypothetical protein
MNVLRYAANGVFAMTTRTHRFKIGQTVSLIPSISRTAAPASLKLLGCTRLRAKRQVSDQTGANYTNALLQIPASSPLRFEARLIEKNRAISGITTKGTHNVQDT